MKSEEPHSTFEPAPPLVTDLYGFDNETRFTFIESSNTHKWQHYDGAALLGSKLADSLHPDHVEWVDKAFFRARQGKLSKFFMHGGDFGTVHWNDVKILNAFPCPKGNMLLQSTTYPAAQVAELQRLGIWEAGETPANKMAWV